jgi:cytochrome bd-type quinol oxidase subunit 2
VAGNVPNYVITWNTGETSTLNVNYTVTIVGGQLVSTGIGTVTSGVFQGGSVRAVLTYARLDLTQCLTPPGIENAAGTATLSIT